MTSSKNQDPRTHDGRPLIEHIKEDIMWQDIRRLAKTNPALKDAVSKMLMIYNLVKSEKSIDL